jgi:ABC-type nitrate/sulfonate/bicarbonate transport system substrate-binding protein
MKKAWIAVAAILFLCHAKGSVAAADDLRAASGGFTTAIHAVLWAAYEEKIFRKYGLDVEYLALQQREIGHANAPLR